MGKARYALPIAAALGSLLLLYADPSTPQSFTFHARDPGVRTGPPGAGGPLFGLTASQLAFFNAGLADFAETEVAAEGLGPTMNLDSCGGCHAQPAVGGSSPLVNPQVAFATRAGAHNAVPSFVRINGPVREARFVKNADGSADGGVHALFTITGRTDAPGCTLSQPDFQTALGNRNVIFRIPTPVFGGGLIEAIPDSVIVANAASTAASKQPLGIGGHANFTFAGRTVSGETNNNGNDGTIARFGWKAQNKSLLLFSGEAYNVEMGISNEIFPTERSENAACQFATTPNDVLDTDTTVNDRGDLGDPALRGLPALPRRAQAVARHARRRRLHRARQAVLREHRVRALPHADAEDRQHDGRGAAQPEREPVLRPAGARHGRRAR